MYSSRLSFILLAICGIANAVRRTPSFVHARDFGGEVDALERRGSSCTSLSAADVKKLPAYAALLATAKKNWGDGSFNLVTNDPSFPDSPALSCVQTGPVVLKSAGKSCSPSCTTSNPTIGGTLQSDGSVSVSTTQGTSVSASVTVSQEASLSIGSSTQVEFSLAEIVKGSETISLSTTVSNSLAQSSTTTSSNQDTETVTFTPEAGKFCKLSLTTQACTVTGTGEVAFEATGPVWFEFNKKTHGHLKWGLDLAAVVPDASQRSSNMSVKAQVSSTTDSNYVQTCT
ncbi:hypothetical protein C8J56DRAFT_1058346 [Mycena floridula]|nr:hypothetical protein C8J56DRAFT_1058346 [Mycena floridula]